MKHNYCILTLVVCLLLAGCMGNPTFSESTTTPENTTATDEYPELPESRSNASLINYAKSHERAVATDWAREITSREIQKITISINNATIIGKSANGTIIHIEYKVGIRAESVSGKVSSSDTQFTTNYYVSDDTVYRASTKGLHRPGPDPIKNGTTVAAK